MCLLNCCVQMQTMMMGRYPGLTWQSILGIDAGGKLLALEMNFNHSRCRLFLLSSGLVEEKCLLEFTGSIPYVCLDREHGLLYIRENNSAFRVVALTHSYSEAMTI
jgi:hypothetical protein